MSRPLMTLVFSAASAGGRCTDPKTPISLWAGDDVGAIDVTFTTTGSSARVSGRVVDPRARWTSFSPGVSSDGNGMPAARMGLNMGVAQSGEFCFPVGPGEYTLVGQSDNGAATQRVSVSQEDIGGIQLVIANHSRISARGILDGTAPRPAGRLMVVAWSPDPLGMGGDPGGRRTGWPAGLPDQRKCSRLRTVRKMRWLNDLLD
jgi:hypothetical protein